MSDTKRFACDFETTVYDDQEDTEVWAASIVDLEAPDDPKSVKVFGSIGMFMAYIEQLSCKNNLILYFHNLSFDGCFIISYLLNSNIWKQDSYSVYNEAGEYCGEAFEKKHYTKMEDHTYRYSVSNKGVWYSITLKEHFHCVEIRDSLKLLPYSLRELGEAFDVQHKKLEMEYKGFRYECCPITVKEMKYIKNDALCLKECLNAMHDEGHDELTIGSCCYKEYMSKYSNKERKEKFPNLYEVKIDGLDISAGEYIHKSYRGGWCYVVPEKAGKIINNNGVTLDYNSMYPSVMHSRSGNRYPIGLPTYFKGEIPAEAKADDKYYFVHVKTRFKLKEGYLPTIQIKYSSFYRDTEWLTTSDVIDKRIPGDDKYKIENRKRFYIDLDGMVRAARPDLYLTQTDWEMIQEHYELTETEIIDGMYFDTEIGLFDEYIDKYAAIKQNSTGPKRGIAKLFMNNLYGQFSKNTDSSYSVMYLNDSGELRTRPIKREDKTPGYIPIGSAITSYGRFTCINAAQANYYGPDKPGFIYSDTDSCHIDLPEDQIKDMPTHPTQLNYWKVEAHWDKAKYVRAKTYVEHITIDDKGKENYYSLKCAGMTDEVKKLFIYSMEQNVPEDVYEKMDMDEQIFVSKKRNLTHFDIGLRIPGMLKVHHIKGGVLLKKGWYQMHRTLEG